ncbi:coiled-coil domain-containing protein 86-like isoform X1 [Dermacentor albipictus]|uniref:coiled-coil domain-containing protein 86-like isoform X1 n=1 Tax=Dermacentor albipictus TaxID=60249 RepID=UPI0031FD234E
MTRSKKKKDDVEEIPRGVPKSGRVWKSEKKRFSSMVKDRPLKTSWKFKMEQRAERKALLALDRELKEEKKRKIEEKKKRREENLRRREENAKKAEVVQVIKNTAKIKRMSKKQLRHVKKADTTVVSKKSRNADQ